MTTKPTPSWEQQLLAEIDPAHIEAVEDMSYQAAKRRMALHEDEVMSHSNLTSLKSVPTGSRVTFQQYLKRNGYKGQQARYLRRRFEGKFTDMIGAMGPPRTEKQIADARFEEWFKAWVVDLDSK